MIFIADIDILNCKATLFKGVAIGTKAAHYFKIMEITFRQDYWGDFQIFLDGTFKGILCIHGALKYISQENDRMFLDSRNFKEAEREIKTLLM